MDEKASGALYFEWLIGLIIPDEEIRHVDLQFLADRDQHLSVFRQLFLRDPDIGRDIAQIHHLLIPAA